MCGKASGPLPPGKERREYLETQPTYWLKRCYQTLRRSVDGELRKYGLTLSQRDVLLSLWEDGLMDQGSLSEKLGLEQSSVSRLVDGLARRGLVRIGPGDTDRRVRVTELTEEGRQLLHNTPGSAQLGGKAMVAGMSDSERNDLVVLLRRCTENLMDVHNFDRTSNKEMEQ